MIKKTFFPILCLSLLLIACGGADENTLEFETVTADKSVNLSNEVLSPTCKVHLELEAVTENMGHRAEVINNTVMKRLLDEEEETMQLAANAFAEKYTESYQKTMLPLYNEDRADTTKRSWYEYHYVVKCSTQRGSKGTYVYLATVDYSEGHANSIHQLIPLNFYSDTGKEITAKQVFVDGYKSQLPRLLLKALMEKTELPTMEQLKEKGYLDQVEMYVPENFIVGDNTITFIFNPSEIASLELGTIELVLTYAQLRKYVKPAFIKSLQ